MVHIERGKILEINDIYASYGSSEILRGVNMTAKKGRVTTIMGRNGVGKSTLLKNLMGLVKTKNGAIVFTN